MTAIRRERRPVRVALAAGGAVAAAGTVAWAAIGAGGGDGGGEPAAPTAPPATAKVEKRTLTRTETVPGELGFGDVRTLAGRPGTLTWLPADGDTIGRGKPVYGVDGAKIPLLYGTTPVYRTLAEGVTGKDVAMLERNLRALGYDGFTADDEYTSGTAAAVAEWQDDLGRAETGTVAKGDVLVAPGAIRIGEVKGGVGDPAQGAVLTWTGTGRKVTADLKAGQADLAAKGARATVELPDGTRVGAVVASVGTAAKAPASGGKTAEATLPVELEIRDQKRLGRYQSAPVDVVLAAESRKDVLAVPITALTALREGGYAVEVAGTGYVKVETGMFAGGLVEVRGPGLAAGLTVGVPK
ncbi:peptidoglycan-binding protein [Actinomadura macrotermitis]|uniref:Peptidoglycan binding-like domain-containing protein n=1 Tax=Actinomadura macrotermitis TaxID=2585200 RepID=A0A7K0BR39_9ACTN|nr:peptidoglycan-binding domain-containing protein [Actinomadura macrotermitis]MQY03655.1 hypothetical protein [Actinomadura macrotermitis]